MGDEEQNGKEKKEEKEINGERMITKTDMQKNPKVFWKEINKMLGRGRTKQSNKMSDEHNTKLNNPGDITEAFR